jgi:stearoyl-CoA desaturase (delta-9 desaturase)
VSNPYLAKAEQSKQQGVSLLTSGVLIVFHVLAIAAFFTFSWRNLAVALVLHWLSVGLGISMGYHRLHTHRGFKTYKWFDYFLAVCGTLTLEGGPIFLVATHRLHHQYSDQPVDPHTTGVSGFWAHLGWIIFGEAQHSDTARLARYAPDLSKDPFYRWLSS